MMLDTRPDARDPALAPLFPFLVEQMPVGVIIAAAPSGRILQANAIACSLIPLDPERRVGYHPDGRRVAPDEWPLARARSGQTIAGEEYQIEQPDGSRRWVKIAASPLRPGGEGVQATLCIVTDIDLSKRQEAALRKAEAEREANRQARELLEALPLAVYTTDAEGWVTYFNQAAADIAGRRPEIGTDRWCIVWRPRKSDGTPLPHDECAMAVALREKRPIRHVEALAERPDGTLVPLALYPTPLFDNAGELVGAVNVLVDLTERRAASEALRRSQAQLATAQRIGAIGSWGLDLRTGEVHLSDEAYRICGLDPASLALTLENAIDLYHPDDQPLIRNLVERAKDGEMITSECRVLRPDGEVRWVRLQYEPEDSERPVARLVGVVQDITQRKRAEEALRRSEERLRESQKLEAVGKLTGGIAHEFNNLLAVVIANMDMVEADPASSGGAESIEVARDACLRGAELTSQLLAFGRRQPLQPRHHRLEGLVSDQMKILAPSLGKDITVRIDLPADIWPVEIDGHQFQLALTNLANNARDAMPNGGTLSLAARNVHLDAGDVDVGFVQGDYVAVEVTDTGIGMTPEVLARAVEPFFSTKEPGRGTGLGLSMVFGFAKQSGGHLDLDSAAGRGTRVLLHLPRAVVRPNAARVAETPDQPRAQAGEVVLVVDDNDPLRRTIARQLGALGYTVLEARDRSEAMDVLTTSPRVDLLLTDMALPNGAHGAAIADQAAAMRNGLRILLMSGTTEDSPALREALIRGYPFLRKPYRLKDLATRLRQLLGS